MSPVDQTLSPAPGTLEALSAFTPYSTTSPAYVSGNPSAASPFSAALAHGSRVLSNIQASPFYNATPMLPQQRFTTIPQSQPMTHQVKQMTPQQGSPEYLKAALHHLQTSLLAKLESEAEAFFDSVDAAVGERADARVVAGKAKALEVAMSSVLEWLEKNGLASVPLLDLPRQGEEPKEESKGATQGVADTISGETANSTAERTTTAPSSSTATATATTSTSTLQSEIDRLQLQAKDLFDRRQRLKESASIVGGILDS